jgi:16S rRNA (guanine966-N2)-methyltransferase
MRITGGDKKGYIIKVPKNIRPTSSFLIKSIFDTLGSFILNKDILELFAGSGALGFEALSRGARSCLFVDISRGSEKSINQNIKILDYDNQAYFIKSDALKFLRISNATFDLILADPPYNYDKYEELVSLSYEKLRKEGIFVLQLSSKIEIEIEKFSVLKIYTSSDNSLYYLLKS